MQSPADASDARGRTRWLLVIGAMAAFVLSCAAARGGFFSSADPGDVGRYHDFVRQMAHGRLPYRDFYMEYPPGALPPFLAPILLHPFADYNVAFKFTVAVAGLGLVCASIVVLGFLRAEPLRVKATLVTIVVAPVALGAVVLNRYDLWPALLLTAALAALLGGRDRLAFGLLAVSCVVKIYPLVALPVVLLHLWRVRGAAAVKRAVKAFVIVSLVCVLPFAAMAPGGLGYSVYTQTIRQLQLESLGSSLLLAADAIGLYSAKIVPGKPGSIDLSGPLPNALGVATTILLVAAIVGVVLAYRRAVESNDLLVLGVAACVTAFVAFSKVISPQFLTWLVPLVPLVRPKVGTRATGLLLIALVLTQVEVVYEHPLRAVGWPVWVLLARNAVLVGLFAELFFALRCQRVQPAR